MPVFLAVIALTLGGASAGSGVPDLADDSGFVLRPELFDFLEVFLCHL